MLRSFIVVFTLLSLHAYCQSVTITPNGSPSNPSAQIDAKSSNSGTLVQRMTSAERLAIASPPIGLLVFDVEKGALYLYDGQNWLPFAFAGKNSTTPIERHVSDAIVGDNIGSRIGISGDNAIVGNPNRKIGENYYQGQAYIFNRGINGWQQHRILKADDGAAYDIFGISVAISGDFVAIGASRAAINGTFAQGAVYIFQKNGDDWSQVAKLTASDGAHEGKFGNAVALAGDYLIVGADDSNNQNNQHAGSAYIFHREGSSWVQQAKISASDGAYKDQFGISVGITSDYAIIGASGAKVGSNEYQGKAYIFVRNGTNWSEQKMLVVANGTSFAQFGFNVVISGDYALVNAPQASFGNYSNLKGSVYTYVRNGTDWIHTQQIFDTNNSSFGASFTTCIAVSGDYLIIGTDGGVGGSIYLYKKNSYNQFIYQNKIFNPSGISGSGFGTGVGIEGKKIIIGATGVENIGKIYFTTID